MPRSSTCPVCHQSIADRVGTTCPHCGALPDDAIQKTPPRHAPSFEPEISPCPRCGQPVALLCLFCPHCDEPLEPHRQRQNLSDLSPWVGIKSFLALVSFAVLLVLFSVVIGAFLTMNWLGPIGLGATLAAFTLIGYVMKWWFKGRQRYPEYHHSISRFLVWAGVIALAGCTVVPAALIFLLAVCKYGR